MSEVCIVDLSYKGLVKGIALYRNIPQREVHAVLRAGFGIPENFQIVGVFDDQENVALPLSLLCKEPSLFDSRYQLLARET